MPPQFYWGEPRSKGAGIKLGKRSINRNKVFKCPTLEVGHLVNTVFIWQSIFSWYFFNKLRIFVSAFELIHYNGWINEITQSNITTVITKT